MQRLNAHIFRLVIILSFTALKASAATVYYVSPVGNDGNAGSQAAPFATIQKAADTVEAGDTVKVLAGVYEPDNVAPYRGMVIFKRSGTPDKPITFEAVGNVVVKGDGGVARFSGIFEVNTGQNTEIHDLVIRGFRLENSTWFGIRLNRARNVTLENNYTYNTGGSGIQASLSHNVTVRGNTLERACISPDKTIDTQEIISLSDTDGFEIANNHIFNGGITGGGNGGEGIDTKGSSRNGSIHHNRIHDLVRLGVYVDSWDKIAENITVYANRVYNCAEGIAVSSENGGTVRNVKIFNNLLYNNQGNGVVISSWALNGRRENIEIINNTIFHNGYHLNKEDLWGGGITIETANATDITIRNNILSENKLWQILVNNKASKITIDYNLINTYQGYTGDNHREVYGEKYIKGNPQFINAKNADFHLKTNSPAFSKGSSLLAPKDDFDSKLRPKDKAPDIGAFVMNENIKP